MGLHLSMPLMPLSTATRDRPPPQDVSPRSSSSPSQRVCDGLCAQSPQSHPTSHHPFTLREILSCWYQAHSGKSNLIGRRPFEPIRATLPTSPFAPLPPPLLHRHTPLPCFLSRRLVFALGARAPTLALDKLSATPCTRAVQGLPTSRSRYSLSATANTPQQRSTSPPTAAPLHDFRPSHAGPTLGSPHQFLHRNKPAYPSSLRMKTASHLIFFPSTTSSYRNPSRCAT